MQLKKMDELESEWPGECSASLCSLLVFAALSKCVWGTSEMPSTRALPSSMLCCSPPLLRRFRYMLVDLMSLSSS